MDFAGELFKGFDDLIHSGVLGIRNRDGVSGEIWELFLGDACRWGPSLVETRGQQGMMLLVDS